MTTRSRSEPQCLKEQPNLAAAFGVRAACFRFGVSATSVALRGAPFRPLKKRDAPEPPRARTKLLPLRVGICYGQFLRAQTLVHLHSCDLVVAGGQGMGGQLQPG